MTVYGYCRVSTLRQANEGESLEFQKRQIEGYAYMHGLDLKAVLVEEGVSGSIPICDRKVGGPMFDALVAGDIVIAAKLDRLFRSALDALTVVEELKQRKVNLHLLDLGGDIAGNGLSRLFLTIAAAFAEAERDRIRERVQQSKADQKARGRFLGGPRPPFGWKKTPDGGLERDEREQGVIKGVVLLRKQGKTLRHIQDRLASSGFEMSHKAVDRIVKYEMARESVS